MQLQNNTILITGGSSGIGLELARKLHQQNTILICGRSMDKLKRVKEELPNIHIHSCDLSRTEDRNQLFEWVKAEHPDCNVLINNAALVHNTNFRSDDQMIEKSILEIETNLTAPIVLCKLFLPLLESNKNPSIINITTGLVYSPRATYPIYNAAKSGLHAFSRVLRHQLKGDSPVKITEVLMTVVDTPWHNGNAPKIAISAQKAVDEMLRKLSNEKEEIRIGKVNLLYYMSRIAPKYIFKKLNALN